MSDPCRRRTSLSFVALATALVAVAMTALPATVRALPGAVAPEKATWLDKLTPNLRAQLATTDEAVNVVVTFKVPVELRTESTASPLRQRFVRSCGEDLAREYAPIGVVLKRRYTAMPMAALRVPLRHLDILAADPRVATVELVLPMRALRNNGKEMLNVPPLASMGFDGTGIGVAVLDTGVDYNHAELAPGGIDAAAKTVKLADTISGDGDPMDEEGHGTAVAGVVGGAGGLPPTPPDTASTRGVAPAARIIAVRVLNGDGQSENDSVTAGVDAVVTSVLAGNPYNIKVVNLSLGGIDSEAWPPNAGNCDELLPSYKMAFDTLTDAGVLVVAAAGNNGCATGVGYPSCISSAMAVGAVQNTSAIRRSAVETDCPPNSSCQDEPAVKKAITCYSNSGDKLSVWAPADNTITAKKTGTSAKSELIYNFNGTSCASPFAAGVAALLYQAMPGASPIAVRNAMETTGEPITDARNGITRNLVNATAAYERLQQGCPTPDAPASLTVLGAICDPQFTVSWSEVAGAASYSLDLSEDEGFASFQSFITTTPSITLYNQPPIPQTLFMRVRTNSACASSAWLTARKTCEPEETYTQVVSGIAKAPGYAPAFWSSDLSVLNPGPTAASLNFTFTGGKGTYTTATTLPAHSQQTWLKVLSTLFPSGNDVGIISLTATQPVLMLARTYSQTSPGQPTFGQEYLGQESTDGLTAGEVGYLPGLRSDGSYYTNVEAANVGNVPADVEFRFLGYAGAFLKSETRTVQVGQRISITKVLPAGHGSVFAEVRTPTADARLLVAASVVDDTSKDPTTVPLFIDRGMGGAHTYFISGIAQWPGFAPAFWYSDAAFLNTGTAPADFTLTFHGSGGNATMHQVLPVGQQLSCINVLTSIFSLTRNDVGLLEVASSQPTVAMARTYSQTSPGQPTYGQGYLGYEASHAITKGQVAYLPGLRNDAPYYTNIELLNVGTTSTDVEVRFFANDGTQVRVITKTVAPMQRVGVSKVLPTGTTMAFAEVRVLSEGGLVLANASVVDDLSKDPTTVPMMVP